MRYRDTVNTDLYKPITALHGGGSPDEAVGKNGMTGILLADGHAEERKDIVRLSCTPYATFDWFGPGCLK